MKYPGETHRAAEESPTERECLVIDGLNINISSVCRRTMSKRSTSVFLSAPILHDYYFLSAREIVGEQREGRKRDQGKGVYLSRSLFLALHFTVRLVGQGVLPNLRL